VIDAGADEGHYDNVAAAAGGRDPDRVEKVDEKLPNPAGDGGLIAQPLQTEKARSVLQICSRSPTPALTPRTPRS